MEVTGAGQLLFLTLGALSWGLHHEEKAKTQAQSRCHWGPHTLALGSASGTLGPLGLWVLHPGLPAMVSGWFLGFLPVHHPQPHPCPSPFLLPPGSSNFQKEARRAAMSLHRAQHLLPECFPALTPWTPASDSGRQPPRWPGRHWPALSAGCVRHTRMGPQPSGHHRALDQRPPPP